MSIYLKEDYIHNNSNFIEIYFGTKKSNQEVSCSIPNSMIVHINKLKEKYNHSNTLKITYHYKDLIHTIHNNKSETHQFNTISHKLVHTNTIDMIIINNLKNKLNSSEFPCSNNYPLIQKQSITEINISHTIKLLIFDSTLKFEIIKNKDWNTTYTTLKTILNLLFQ